MVRSSSISSNSSFPATSWVSLHQQTNLIYPHLNILLRLPQLNPFFYHQPLPSHLISDSVPSPLQSGFSLQHSWDSALRTQSHFAAFASVCHSFIGTHSVVRLQIPPWLCVSVSHYFFWVSFIDPLSFTCTSRLVFPRMYPWLFPFLIPHCWILSTLMLTYADDSWSVAQTSLMSWYYSIAVWLHVHVMETTLIQHVPNRFHLFNNCLLSIYHNPILVAGEIAIIKHTFFPASGLYEGGIYLWTINKQIDIGWW